MEKFVVDKIKDQKINSINRTIRFRGDHYDKILEISEQTGVSFNKIVVMCIEYALKNME